MLEFTDRVPVAARDPFHRPFVVVSRRTRRLWNVTHIAMGALLAAIVVASAVEESGDGTMAEVFGYLAIGFTIGLVTCIPIGVANVTVIDTVYRHGLARGIAVGLGGAIADGLYSSVGIFGVGRFLASYPAVPYVLFAISGLVLLVYGLLLLRSSPVDVTEADLPAPPPGRHLMRGVLVGLGATLLNPSAIVTWVVIVASYTVGVSTTGGAAWVLGIVIGSFAWFCVVAFLALHGKRVLRSKAIWMTRIIGLLVIGYGLFSLVRVVRYVLADSF